MPSIPHAKGLDNTIALLREGYPFISSRCDAMDTDIFATRLMLRPAICVRGASAASMFYHSGRFTRHGAMPPTTIRLLQDVGSVELQDGASHRARKAMFMGMMTPERLDALTALAEQEWRDALSRWERRDAIVLFDEVRAILCRTACRWAGVPLPERQVGPRTHQFAAMIDNAGRFGPRNWWAQLRRQGTERWAGEFVERYRRGELDVPADHALAVIADYREPDGQPLSTEIAAVELINILRPTVAVARFVAFEAHALYRHPDAAARVRDGDDGDLERFVQEVRRSYPYFPFIGGRALEPIDWEGYAIDTGDWVLLDLYGTDHDRRLWEDPQVFRPERFRDWDESAYTLIPQGAGDHYTTHRCAGEWPTIHLMRQAAAFLTREMRYEVPEQDLSIDLSRMPARPKSGVALRDIRPAA